MEEIEDIIASAEEDAGDFPDDDEDSASLTWTIVDGNTAIKQTDRAAFLYRETILPLPVQEFFGVLNLDPGHKKRLVLLYGTRRFDTYIEKTVHTSPVTRMIWKADFAAMLNQQYPLWLDFFKKTRAEAVDAPTIQFTRRRDPDHFDLELEGACSQETAGDFEVPYSPGDTVDNDTLRTAFRCGPQGAIRRSHGINSLVLVSDHTSSSNEDKWIGKVFHFTGPGSGNERGLSSPLNKTLAGSPESGIRLFLFEVFEDAKYVFIGEAELADSPYRSRQADGGKNPHDVYVFPLKLKGGGRPPVTRKDLSKEITGSAQKKGKPLPLPELEFQARYAVKTGGRREVVSEVFEPDRIVSEYARRRANGTCQLCNQNAPFVTADGEPYLEIHHIIPLIDGGEDVIGNVVALCPNCHRKMHLLNLPPDVALLKRRTEGKN
ncbi:MULTISPECIES: HNH endonuclease signature motif containing protein [unclassified Methanoregula]|uniref:HNH endonuclease n=1 Tax=unclassified Methanoregula TaxID=2649730 RepID=UPI0009D178C8|nr:MULTISPECIES: HNH endonuclease signature motif containing protein [unclassified Methanoregula]OPX61938.1 MAG: HNH endonuclease [Methanoregula sp. PtaB.Bin085]OPY34387.1 MAG: HNH endonuclease [Methanoregula sp. PtaU1.Bin006]